MEEVLLSDGVERPVTKDNAYACGDLLISARARETHVTPFSILHHNLPPPQSCFVTIYTSIRRHGQAQVGQEANGEEEQGVVV